MRHGKAEKEGTSDKVRPLKPRGLSDSFHIGEQIQQHNITIDKVICSPALRTKQTLQEVEKSFPKPVATAHEESLYLAHTIADFRVAISRHIQTTDKTILVVGHNPIISGFVEWLTDKPADLSPGDCHVVAIDTLDWEEALASEGLWTERLALTRK
jgi:phosphohistidine phosphatase